MKRLSDIDLPDSMQWVDKDESNQVMQSVTYTLSGRPVIRQSARSERPITLLAEDDVTWLDRATVDALLQLAAIPGATTNLEWDDEKHRVMMRHHEPPAMRFEPIWPGSDQYIGMIKLIAV